MANETLFKKTIVQSQKDVTLVDLPLGTETVAGNVAAGEIAIVIGSGIDKNQSGYIDAVIKEIADFMRETEYT
jgi:hypothetical protein